MVNALCSREDEQFHQPSASDEGLGLLSAGIGEDEIELTDGELALVQGGQGSIGVTISINIGISGLSSLGL